MCIGLDKISQPDIGRCIYILPPIRNIRTKNLNDFYLKYKIVAHHNIYHSYKNNMICVLYNYKMFFLRIIYVILKFYKKNKITSNNKYKNNNRLSYLSILL